MSAFQRALRAVAAAALSVALVGCAVEPEPVPEPSPEPSTRTPLTDAAGLAVQLRAAGSSVVAGGAEAEPLFDVPAMVLIVDGERVEVYEYETEADAEAAAAGVSPDGHKIEVAQDGFVVASDFLWVATPHFYRSGPLVVLYVGDDEATTSALEALFGEQFAGG